VLLAPRVVVVVVDLLERRRPEDLEHLVHHDVAARVGVAAGELHRGDVLLAALESIVQQLGRRVHRPVAEVAGGGLVAEAARAEVDADPDAVRPRRGTGRRSGCRRRPCRAASPPGRAVALEADRRLADLVEHRMVGALLVRDADAERDPRRDLVHEARHVLAMSLVVEVVSTALLPQPMS
jgi:hypothetical protein